MSVSIAYAREMVAKHSRYKESPDWVDKVYHMPQNQVLAIYHKMLALGEFMPKKKKTPEILRPAYTQPTLFDFGLEVDHNESTPGS